MTLTWRLAPCIRSLQTEINSKFPDRPKQTDGTKGDAAHEAQGSSSDHNAWLDNTVRAWDITTSYFTDDLAERLRLRGLQGDHRLIGGGYVIHKSRIASDNGNWQWRKYTGSDPHTSHIHLSVTRDKTGYDDASPWGIYQTGDDDMTTKDEVKQIVDQSVAELKRDLLFPMNDTLNFILDEVKKLKGK